MLEWARLILISLQGKTDIVNSFTRLDVYAYPIKYELIEKMCAYCDVIYIFEEDYPYIEDMFISREGSTKNSREKRQDNSYFMRTYTA